MKSRMIKSERAVNRLPLLLIVIGILAAVPWLSGAWAQGTINITIVNNSRWEIRRVYLAAGDPNNWGPDQLNGSVISPGSSFTLSNVSCDGASIRVITEDQNGCFLYDNVSCGGNATWTITNDATPDCGG
jgi:hypothetical protein